MGAPARITGAPTGRSYFLGGCGWPGLPCHGFGWSFGLSAIGSPPLSDFLTTNIKEGGRLAHLVAPGGCTQSAIRESHEIAGLEDDPSRRIVDACRYGLADCQKCHRRVRRAPSYSGNALSEDDVVSRVAQSRELPARLFVRHRLSMPRGHVAGVRPAIGCGSEKPVVEVEVEMVRLHEPHQMHRVDRGRESPERLVDVRAHSLGAREALITDLYDRRQA